MPVGDFGKIISNGSVMHSLMKIMLHIRCVLQYTLYVHVHRYLRHILRYDVYLYNMFV